MQGLPQGALWTAPISAEEARRALKDATLLTESSPTDALVKLRLVERAMPRIADRLALKRADLLKRLDRMSEACDAYRVATTSPQPSVAAEGRIGLVSCLLDVGDKQGEAEFDRLCRRYPALGERPALQVKLARARERWHNVAGAVPLYRAIDLYYPESEAAADAREALNRLREQGVAVQPFTPAEWVERAERTVYRGTVEAGHNAVGDLLANSVVRGLFKGRAHILAARVARMEGRWDVVRDEVAQAIDAGIPSSEAQRWLPRLNLEQAEPGQGEEKLRRLLAGRPVDKLKGGQLRTALDLAVNYEIRDVATEALTAITTQQARVNPQAVYEAAIYANGVAAPEALLAAFESVRNVRPLQLAAAYYHARALEALGRLEEARAEYREVSQLDARDERFYGLWAEARLTGLDQLASGGCDRDEHGNCRPDVGLSRRGATTAFMGGPSFATGANGLATGSARAAVPGLSAVFGGERDELSRSAYLPSPADARRETIVSRLGALVAVHGAAYPWLARAMDLVELELYDDAATEVGETYIAYRDARGGIKYRVGAEAVLSNAMQPHHECSASVRRDRLAFDEPAKLALADVADMLGEAGIALRLRDMQMDAPPRAYAEDVVRAANKFGLDPNLMFAVMRVESVYYRHIVSFAGAVGLMQIMPQTGMRIARALGLVDFNPRELLEPRRNIEFAAWYLASLIRRFDGRIPLAIAAYNGGPHNVRLWINARPKTMPLEVFMEHLPFRETHHYVRRVLTTYSIYRAQEGLGMPNLAMTLPRPRPDAIAF